MLSNIPFTNLNNGIVPNAHALIKMALGDHVVSSNINASHSDSVPAGGGEEKEVRVDDL